MSGRLVTLLGALALALSSPEPAYWPTSGWRTSTPEAQGFDSAKLADALTVVRDRHIPIHSLQIVRNGYLILDAYFYPYDRRSLHDLASVTKSVTATLVGMASAQGVLPPVKAPLLPLFPTRRIANRDERKDAMTVEDLLTMRPGFECVEGGGERTLREMRQQTDWVQFALDRPMTSAPGQTFAYCSPGMHVLSAALTAATRGPALDFARRVLFAPLGINNAVWPADSQGNSFGWGDLHLHPLDMAKLGYLYLHDGRWAGRQILPDGWVRAATAVHASPRFRNSYGYGWWVFTGAREGQYEAVGRGGQRITVIPAENLIVVLTGGGFEPGDVGNELAKALGPNRPLPDNAGATSRLAAAVRAAAMPPAPVTAAPLPAIAARVSGVRYQVPSNDLGLRSAELHFASASEGTFVATFADGRSRRFAIGMDGVPRISKGGRFEIPVALSGQWTSPDTFNLNYDETGNINMFRMQWTFTDPTQVKIDVAERSDGATFTLSGTR